MKIHKTRAVTPMTPSTVTMRLNGLRPGPTKTCSGAVEDDAMADSQPDELLFPMLYCSNRVDALQHANLASVRTILYRAGWGEHGGGIFRHYYTRRDWRATEYSSGGACLRHDN